MGAVAAQQQLAVATDPAAKQHAVNSLLHAQSQVVASANAAANAAVIQTQNALNQPHFTPPILIPHNPFPGHQSPRSGASSPAPGVDFGPHHYPPSPLPFVNPGYFNPGVTPMQTSSPVHSPMHQRGGPKSASAFYQQRGGYASQNAGPPPLKRQGSGLVSAAEVIEQIASGGQPTPEQQAAMEGGVMHAPSRGGRRSPASTRQRGQLLNIGAQAFEPRPDSGESGGSRDGSVHGSKDGPGRGPLPRSGSVRAMTSYERSSSDEGQKEERGPKGLKKSGRALKRSSSQSSMKRWDGALVLADGPVDPDALRVGKDKPDLIWG